MVITYSEGKDQPSKVADPARGQLNRENECFPVPSCVRLLISIFRLNLVLTYEISPELRDGVHLFIETAIRHRVSPDFVGSRNCVPMAFTAESPPAQSQ